MWQHETAAGLIYSCHLVNLTYNCFQSDAAAVCTSLFLQTTHNSLYPGKLCLVSCTINVQAACCHALAYVSLSYTSLWHAVAGKQVVANCLTGYNSCIFAYGQTGSGKTHTMLGHMQEAIGGGISSTDHVVCCSTHATSRSICCDFDPSMSSDICWCFIAVACCSMLNCLCMLKHNFALNLNTLLQCMANVP